MKETEDRYLLTDENLIAQLETAPYELGYYKVRFYSENGRPAKEKTGVIEDYYLYPSGGTLRDKDFNIVFYDSRFDTYRGYEPPHLKRKGKQS